MSYLGLDLGTSGLRALLVDESGKPLGSAEKSYAVSNPHPGWSEQNPADWVAALDTVMDELRSRFPAFSELRGIGVAGHMHGATLMDAKGEVLRPCILWNDVRSEKEAAALDQTPGVRALSGNIVFPGFTAPKLLWVQTHEPEIFAKVDKVLLPAAFLNHHLTGTFVADMSDSAGTSWLDVGERCWSSDLLAAGGMAERQMPALVEGSEPAGPLRSDLRKRWGLKGEVIVAGGAGDNAAAAVGIGALQDGAGFVSLGTSGVVLVARDRYAPAPETAVHTFCHAIPDHWYQMGVMLSATDCLNWLSRIADKTPSDLTRALGERLCPPGDMTFYPYLSGERTPHNDSQIRGGFTGLNINSGTEALTRAVLEGVAFGLKDSLDALKSTGAQIDQLTAIGGGSASRYWLSLIATCLNVSLTVPEGSEFGAALGAARLGMLAAGAGTVSDIVTAPQARDVVEPIVGMSATFAEKHQAFRAGYEGLKSIQ